MPKVSSIVIYYDDGRKTKVEGPQDFVLNQVLNEIQIEQSKNGQMIHNVAPIQETPYVMPIINFGEMDSSGDDNPNTNGLNEKPLLMPSLA